MVMECCSICLELLEENVYTLTCNHDFHEGCIIKWLYHNTSCPLCRTSIEASDKYVEDGIITEERRLYIEQLKNSIKLIITELEKKFPNALKGFTEESLNILNRENIEQQILDNHNELLNTLSNNMINKFYENGGFKLLINYFL